MESTKDEENKQTVSNLPEVKENIGINLTEPEKKEESSSTILSTETIVIPPVSETKKRVRKDGKERKPFVFTEKRKEAFEKCRQSRLDYIEKKKIALQDLGLEKETNKREQQLERLKNKYIEKMRRAGIDIEICESQLGKRRTREPNIQSMEQQQQPENQNGSGAGNHAPFEGESGYNGGISVDPSVISSTLVRDEDVVMTTTTSTTTTATQNELPEKMKEDVTQESEQVDDEQSDESVYEMNDEGEEDDNTTHNELNSVEHIQSQIEEIRASRPPETLPTVFEERRSSGKTQRPNNSEFFLGHIHDYRSHPSQLFSNTGTKQISGGSKIVWLE